MTTRLGMDETGTVVWRWEGEAFGESEAEEDPDGDGQVTVMRLRFPGQYYDTETNLFYNWNRYYDPTIGRYITSDPIGLQDGLNTYIYVDGNPVMYIDPLGLAYNPRVEHGMSRSEALALPPFKLDPNCTYYNTRCTEDGGFYYCILAPIMCHFWPDILRWPDSSDDWVECSRECLQEKDIGCNITSGECSDEGIDSSCNIRIHWECWLKCF